jgi:hypothetical protein
MSAAAAIALACYLSLLAAGLYLALPLILRRRPTPTSDNGATLRAVPSVAGSHRYWDVQEWRSGRWEYVALASSMEEAQALIEHLAQPPVLLSAPTNEDKS